MSDAMRGKPGKGKKGRARAPSTQEANAAPTPRTTETEKQEARRGAPQPDSAPAGTSAGTKASALIGLVAAMVLAVLINVLASRHYRRWDFTRGGLYTLSAPTVQTLRSLSEPIRLDILLPSDSPLTISLRQLLEAYRSETSRLEVHFTDADRHPAEFIALQRRYAERVIDGRVVSDAAIIVARGERAHFVAARDLVEIDDEDDVRARPRLEQALTTGIRAVLSTDKPRVCFTSGHGEKTLDEGGSGLAPLREGLARNGIEVASVTALRTDDDKDRARTLFEGCRVVVVPGPGERFSAEETGKLKAFIEGGGNALIAVGPVPDASDQHYVDLGLGPVIALAGVELSRDVVFEADPRMRSTRGYGETFMPSAKAHPITEGLLRADETALGAVMTIASSLKRTGAGNAAAVPLLETSEDAFGMIDFLGWAKNPSTPTASDADLKGPLTVAWASELPAKPGAERGARMVVIGSASLVMGDNWQMDDLRGSAIFVESAIAWLAARPMPLDIPDKPSFTAGLRLSEDALSSIYRYVVWFVPLASLLTGSAVFLRRRSTDRRGARKKAGDA